MRSRGQISNIDLAVAFVVVLFILLSVFEVWNMSLSRLARFESKRVIDRRVSETAELLVKTPGAPSDWWKQEVVNSTSVQSMGFAEKDNILSSERLGKAYSLDYETMKEILSLSKEEYYITVSDLESANRTIIYAMGRKPGKYSVVVSRYAILNDTIVELKVSLYYDDSTFMTT